MMVRIVNDENVKVVLWVKYCSNVFLGKIYKGGYD